MMAYFRMFQEDVKTCLSLFLMFLLKSICGHFTNSFKKSSSCWIRSFEQFQWLVMKTFVDLVILLNQMTIFSWIITSQYNVRYFHESDGFKMAVSTLRRHFTQHGNLFNSRHTQATTKHTLLNVDTPRHVAVPL